MSHEPNALAEALSAKNSAEALLSATRQALAELQPDLLQTDQTRLKRACDQAGENKREAETKRAVAQAALRSDGTDDPEAALALAVARVHSAQDHLASVRRKAEAIRLLDRLFLEEQRALAEQFTKPFAERISAYLQCLFGAGARAAVTLADNAFTGLQLVRPNQGGGATSFDTLSGGAREQVAAAVRLAMAEVLAADHDGCLPLVFDDAFAYSDPERVQILQRMLDLAASRGLQLIILTCNPSDYAALGARQISCVRNARLPPSSKRSLQQARSNRLLRLRKRRSPRHTQQPKRRPPLHWSPRNNVISFFPGCVNSAVKRVTFRSAKLSAGTTPPTTPSRTNSSLPED